MLIFTLPILGLPISLYTRKSGMNWFIIGSLGAIALILGIFHQPSTGISVATILIIPSLLCGYRLKKNDNLVHTALYTTIIVFIGFLLLFTYGKYFEQKDYIGEYYNAVENVKKQVHELIENQNAFYQENLSSEEERNAILEYNSYAVDIMNVFFYQIQYFFMGLLFTIAMGCAFALTMLTQAISWGFNWGGPSYKKFVAFQVPRSMAVTFGVSWIAVSYFLQETQYPQIYAALSNMLFILDTLFFVIGGIVFIHFIRVLKINSGGKVALALLGMFWLVLNPVIFVIVGVVEGLFHLRNFRRSDTN